ncbi:MAG: hypothetical protein QXU32_00640 [Nitrososphaerales archaeon]
MLKHYGSLSLMEQSVMTAEERKWWLKRLCDENEKQANATKQSMPSGKLPESPGRPPI